MKTCYIIGSVPSDLDGFLPEDSDFIICADGGYDQLAACGILPDLVIGDFDSLNEEKIDSRCEVIRLNPVKDDTDMISAVKTALARGWKNFAIYGALGMRLDHTLANVQTLSYLLDHAAKGWLLDGKIKVTMLEQETLRWPKDASCYLSVFAFGGACCDVTLKGVKYPLLHANVTTSFPIGVSNEILDDYAEIINGDGRLVVMSVPKD